MALKTLISWGVGLLLATTLGCTSGNVTQSACPSTNLTVCTINGAQSCTDTSVDASNCGRCGNVCNGSTPYCSNGTCSANCQSGQENCGNSCVTLATDPNNCGKCGNKCSSNSCSNSTCQSGTTPSAGGSSSVGGSSTSSNGGNTANPTGGTTSTSSNQNGGSGQGGSSTSSPTGGTSARGGSSNTGGTSTSTGGTSSSSNGGTSAKGGTTSSNNGGTTSNVGGTNSVGGTSSANGGGNVGGTSTSTSTSSGARPPGYYMTSDWKVSSVDWHGCVWTGIDSTVSGSTTKITSPASKDYTSGTPDGGPYQVAGTVYNDYNAVAMIGFNLNEATTGSDTLCKYDPAAATAAGPPAATIPSSATGIAVNFTMTKAPPTSFRIQIQMTDGATNKDHRWCATITSSGGKTFVPFSDFLTQCWNAGKTGTGADGPGNKYANEAIDAVVFLVPGTVANTAPFDFTIIGFAPGTKADDAPGSVADCGKTTGTLGSTTASEAASMQRASVTGTDCNQYIIFNNNWGNPTGSTQTIDFVGNSFTVKTSTGSGSSAPASFPSIYVGANGDIAGGTYNTWPSTGLPKQISAITSAKTKFTWSGGSGGDYNATYDVWFNKGTPTAGGYNDAISGFIMVWLYKPGSRQPIGSVKRTASIASHSWDVWIGPRGNTSTGTDDANRPVISYVSKDGSLSSLDFDLKDFIADAVTNASSDKSAGGTSQAFANTWYLTDVFAGFEIWSGSSGVGLKDSFTFSLNK
jgi:hypothetical protein